MSTQLLRARYEVVEGIVDALYRSVFEEWAHRKLVDEIEERLDLGICPDERHKLLVINNQIECIEEESNHGPISERIE
jgi:hypothetical protein